jgi:opacity protein-like surface antigen
MNKLRALRLAGLVVAGFGLSSVAHSQSFNGGYIDVGVGFRGTTANVTVPGASVDMGKSGALGSVAAGWSWNPGGGFVLGVGAFANDGSSSAAQLSAGGATLGLKQKEGYGVSIEPGVEMGQSNVAYLKLSANWAKFEGAASLSGLGSISTSDTYTGFGYGAGVKHLMNNNMFVFAEWQQVDFQSKDVSGVTIKPKNTLGLIGVGWQF